MNNPGDRLYQVGLKIALIGYGKMGKTIEEIAINKGHQIVLKITSANQKELTTANLQQADVAIEFTTPHSAFNNIKKCIDAGLPVVSGTTGWLERWEEIRTYCLQHDSGLLYASNFSIGVNIFFELNKKLASLMATQPDYDVHIEEIHHTQKKDSPSGTAITIAEQIINEIPGKTAWVNRESANHEELIITSRRVDPAAGTHKVTYYSEADSIEIIHMAHNRDGFAKGALQAAEFLKNKKGVFTMKDVLHIS